MEVQTNLSIDIQKPVGVYRPIKRCPKCQSVYLTDRHCEACGLVFRDHPLGTPFGEKSLWGILARYYEQFPLWMFWFPKLESKSSPGALNLVRLLLMRLEKLLLIFDDNHDNDDDYFKYFYFEIFEIISFLADYHCPQNKFMEVINRPSSLDLFPSYKNEMIAHWQLMLEKEEKKLKTEKELAFVIGEIRSRPLGVFFVILFFILVGSLLLNMFLANKSINDFSFFLFS